MPEAIESFAIIEHQRFKTSLRRTGPHEHEDGRERYFARLSILNSAPWHVIEIASEEDWFHVGEDITYPAPQTPHIEIWVQFKGCCMRLYPSLESLAIEILHRKMPHV